MVNKKPPQPTKKSPVIAEPALANRPKRNISPKSWVCMKIKHKVVKYSQR